MLTSLELENFKGIAARTAHQLRTADAPLRYEQRWQEHNPAGVALPARTHRTWFSGCRPHRDRRQHTKIRGALRASFISITTNARSCVYTVVAKRRIPSDNDQALDSRLGDQHPVEGIVVMPGQGGCGERVSCRHGQLGKIILPDLLNQVGAVEV